MQTTLTLDLFIEPTRQGTYFFLPFTMPPDTAALNLRYAYARHRDTPTSTGEADFTSRQEINIIDLGLIAPDGTEAGSSGSDKLAIHIDEVAATPGYRARALAAGAWQILVGAYKVAPEGVQVTYELTFTPKAPHWLKGDLHTHTWASDGVMTAEELGWRAKRHGLDFLAITDHNQPVSPDALPRIPGLTLIPGVEWTHYQGHANFLGVERPYDGTFAANTLDEIRQRFESAHQRGALITLNHPFHETCGFHIDYQALPFDCLEVWNGPMRPGNLKTMGLWQAWLSATRKVPICGGSDFHRDSPFQMLGGPTNVVYAASTGASDILAALRAGHAYITFAPDGPWLELHAGAAMMGDTVRWQEARELHVQAGGLEPHDQVRLVTGEGSETLVEAPSAGQMEARYVMKAPGFARVEIWRAFLPGLPLLPAALSNPVYFDE